MHLVHVRRSQKYISELVQVTADLPDCGRLRSTSSSNHRHKLSLIKLSEAERCFLFADPYAWNSLPTDEQKQANTVTYKRRLKSYLFILAYKS